MRRTMMVIAAATLALTPGVGLADEATYPEQVYTGSSPASDDWLALFALDGRWAIQVGDGCPTIVSGVAMNVMLTAPVETGEATLVAPDSAEFGAGETCPVTS